jgi:DNA-binding response OmpR family regulator
MSVLVVDDDPALRDYVCDLLRQGGFNVLEAESGTSAIAKLKESMPECIVLDLLMPGLSGFDTLREMRKAYPDLAPVIVLTSMDGGATKTYATKVNKASAFVTKAEMLDPVLGLLTQVKRYAVKR